MSVMVIAYSVSEVQYASNYSRYNPLGKLADTTAI